MAEGNDQGLHQRDEEMKQELDAWAKFCQLWREMMAHLSVYGHPPHYRRAAEWMAAGGITSGKTPEDFPL